MFRTDSEKRLSSGGMIPEIGGGHGVGMASSSAQVQRPGSGQMSAAAPHRTSLFGGATGTDMDRDFVMIDLKTPFATQASSA